jgi:hypothetical protein
MASKVYETDTITLVDGVRLYITPLKIIFLRQFMEKFDLVKSAKTSEESMTILAECATIAMQQYYPSIDTVEKLEDSIDVATMYKILDVAGGIKMNQKEDEEEKVSTKGPSWEELDLAKLEAEVFILGIWKDYEDLERSLSMPELLITLELRRDLDYTEKKFLAAIQGVDLDKQSGKADAWEEMKARVFSGGKASDSNDILALQGVNAQKAGFGIGNGISYERID